MPSPDRFLFTVLHWWIIRGVHHMESPDLGEHHIFNPCTSVWARWGCVKDPLSFQFFDDAVMTKWSMTVRKKHNVRNVCQTNDTTVLPSSTLLKDKRPELSASFTFAINRPILSSINFTLFFSHLLRMAQIIVQIRPPSKEVNPKDMANAFTVLNEKGPKKSQQESKPFNIVCMKYHKLWVEKEWKQLYDPECEASNQHWRELQSTKQSTLVMPGKPQSTLNPGGIE